MTNNKQQATVDWLEKQTRKPEWHSLKRGDIFEQAKEIEKERMIQFAKHCLDKALDLDVRTAYSQVEKYYNETYGGCEQ